MRSRYPLNTRILMRGLTRAYRDCLPAGEKILAYDSDMSDGDYWFLTATAICIVPTATNSNERLGRQATSRIPLDEVVGFTAYDRGSFLERVLEAEDVNGEQRVITSWYDGRRTGAWFDNAMRAALAERR
jgi:hypothetical protein